MHKSTAPNVRGQEILGFLPVNISSEVLSGVDLEDCKFIIWHAARTASTQKKLGILPSLMKLCMMLRMVRFFFSATPLCCGVYGCVSCHRMPCDEQYEEKA